VKDAVGAGAPGGCWPRRGQQSSRRDRPDRLEDTRRCYIKLRQCRESYEGAGTVCTELSYLSFPVWQAKSPFPKCQSPGSAGLPTPSIPKETLLE
jgi:hypothetical protein